MKRFKRLLAVIGGGPGDPEVVRRAVALAKSNRARLVFCTTIDAPPPAVGVMKGARWVRELDRLMRKERQAALDEALRQARARRQPARARFLEGNQPFVAIIREVLRDERDLVLVPDDLPISLRSRLFGSTATHLLRKCPCPVWVLKGTPPPSGRDGLRRVLAAIDATTEDPLEARLNKTILELATSLAERESAEVHVVHCWSVYGESMLAARGRLSPRELASYRRETERRHGEALRRALEPFRSAGRDVREHLTKGDPGSLIPRLAEKLRAGVVVMGTVARTGIDGVFIGNTAEHVLQRIGRSVLAVKPDGFVSPVALTSPAG